MFRQAVEHWKAAALKHAEAKLTYELALGKALLEATAKNAEGRKAEAEAVCVEERKAATTTEIERDAAYQVMIHLRGTSEPPSLRVFGPDGERRAVVCAECDGVGWVHGGPGDAIPATFTDTLHKARPGGVIEPCEKCNVCPECGRDGCGPGVRWEDA